MRYILNNDGYIDELSFDDNPIECKSQICIEYNGTTPTGYNSLNEWATGEEGKLNAWKIVEGNLVFDPNKYEELQILWGVQDEENTNATHKWVRNQLGKESQVVLDEFSTNVLDIELVALEDSGAYDIPEIVVSGSTVTGNVNVLVSNKNLLKNEAVTTTISGVTFTINSDKSITLDGTSTEAIEFNLGGTSTSTDMLFLIKSNTNYVKSGLTENVSLSLYKYDGTDRTLISNGVNGIINLTTGSIVTQSTLNILTGTTFDEVTISPMIEVASEATEYIKHQENKAIGTLSNNTYKFDNELDSYDDLSIVMNDRELEMSVTYFTGKSTQTLETSIQALDESIETSVKDIQETLSDVGEAIETINSTMMKQTPEAFEMLFEQSGYKDIVDNVNELLDDNVEDVNTIKQYIRFEGGIITLGASDSNSKLIIQKDRISFMTGDNESAYISQNQLYITDSTILRKLQVGHWVTLEDEYGNLNTRWVGEE